MSETNTKSSLIAVDDGYAQIKLYGRGPEGKAISFKTRSSVRSGRHGVGNVNGDGFVGLYGTEVGPFTVSEDIESENTQFNGFHTSPMNRVLVNHGLASAEKGILGGQPITLITGLPVADFFRDGMRDNDKIAVKTKNLMTPVEMLSRGNLPIISEVMVGCQAVAAWFDFVFDDNLDIRNDSDGEIAIIDIGGRTTDIATVIGGRSVDHSRSGTADIGVLNVYGDVNRSINSRFDLRDDRTINALDVAVRTKKVKIWNEQHDISDIVDKVIAEYSDKIAREVERKIKSGASMDAIVFVGGGSALFTKISQEFRNGVIVDDPEFANARGLYKWALSKEQDA